MEKFRNTLLADIECLRGASKEQLDSFVRVFFNRRNSNNRTLILGAGNASIIKEIISIPGTELINDDKSYLVRIRKVKPGNDRIIFSFNPIEHNMPFEKKNKIREMFRAYQCSENVDLDSALDNGSIPPLCLPMSMMDFSTRKHEYLSVLSGEGCIKEVVIESSMKGSTMVAGSSEVVIIPSSYEPLVQESAVYSNSEKHENSFWKSFSKSTFISHADFNFVILNSVNDHLFRVFSELVEIFRCKYGISTEHDYILSRIFFIKDSTLLNDSRVTEDKSESETTFFSHLHSSPESLLDVNRDIQLYVCMLDRLSAVAEMKVSHQVANYLESCNGSRQRVVSAVDASLKTLAASIDVFPSIYGNISAQVRKLNELACQGIEDRETAFSLFSTTISNVISFSDQYCRSALSDAYSLKKDIEIQRDSCMKKAKGFLKFGYEVKDKMYTQWATSAATKVVNLWEKTIIPNLDIDVWTDVDRAIAECKSVCAGVSDKVTTMPVFIQNLICFGKQVDSFETAVNSLNESLGSLSSACDLESLMSGKALASMEYLRTQWNDEVKDSTCQVSSNSANEVREIGLDSIKKRLSAKLNEMMDS